MAEFAKMCGKDYRLKRRFIKNRNPHFNAIIERINHTIVNTICTFDIKKIDIDNPWYKILATTMFGVFATCHATLGASPVQLVSGGDVVLNVKHVNNWEHICQPKRARTNKNNMRENSHHIAYEYTLGQNILLKRKKAPKYEQEFKGHYEITVVYDNLTIPFQKVKVNNVTNIRRIKQFIE